MGLAETDKFCIVGFVCDSTGLLFNKYSVNAVWCLPYDRYVILLMQGRFTIAAKHHMTIAEIYETDMVDVEKVMCASVLFCIS